MRFSLSLIAAGLWGSLVVAAPPTGHQPQVQVSAATRLDWVFALANQSLPEPPADWLKDYDSTAGRYELDVPANYDPGRAWPLVLFISAGGGPAGHGPWRQACQQGGMLFASPHGAGNDTPGPRRVRIVLDTLDDIRRKYRIDPDRTYLAGFSGGARVACMIGFALPELFGGVIPVCASGELREEPWLRQRVAERLSVAQVTGETDFNRGEVERYRAATLAGMGVRVKTWVVPKLGHAIPAGAPVVELHRWLEEAAAARARLAETYPASRIAGDAAPSREAWAKALFNEGQARLKNKATLYSGLMQLKGVSVRWSDLPVARRATEALARVEAGPDKSWEQEDIAEQFRFLVASARGLDAYASGPIPATYQKLRPQMIAGALGLWKQVLAHAPDSPAGKEAAQRIPALEKLQDQP